jgi:hypothetical protein
MCEFSGSLAWYADLAPVHPFGDAFPSYWRSIRGFGETLPAQHAEGRVRFEAQARIEDALHYMPSTGIVFGIAGQPVRQSAEPMRVPAQRTRAKT